ncbi:MAG: hypothetical protein H0V45_04685 [Actinobacteria bacterium]|nr:hypothetical protein [Actinomycetota bacterium]
MLAAVLGALLLVGIAGATAPGDPLDPAHNLSLPCEALSTPGAVPRSAKNVVHVANVCGFVATDIEFQSRKDASGKTRDYAFVGTMGVGLRIFDITDPEHPTIVGGYADPGWEGDVQVRENTAVIAFDPVGVTPTVSACLKLKSATNGGVDIVRLKYDAVNGTFQTALLDCVLTPGRGAHNSTLHASGNWLAISAPSTNGMVDVVDLRGPAPVLRYRIIGTSTTARCPVGATYTCIVTGKNWAPHDVSFSRDGNTMYVAAVGNDTVIMDVTNVLSGTVTIISVIPNDNAPGGLANPGNIEISHQSDVSADGKILLITDERGGGLENTACNEDPNGVIGAGHFWALAPIEGVSQTAGATPATPKKLGFWVYPNPTLLVDVFDPLLTALGRTERGCTIHLFRLGGNGGAGPGPIDPFFDGVSGLPNRELAVAHYGAGIWHLDFSGPPSSTDGIAEDPRTTWGNTLGWNVMPGADTWSAKEYKGYVYAGDMTRGLDVYRFTDCDGAGCVVTPEPSTPGKATGGGQVDGGLAELAIVRGTAAGGRANFGFNAQFSTGVLSGQLTFNDQASGKKVQSTVIDSYTQAGSTARFTGRARVNGTPGVGFVVEVEDLGEPGRADAFRIVLQDGYGAGGVLLKGNIQVQPASLLP